MVDRADDTRFNEAGIHVGGTRPPLKAPIQLSDNARTVLTKRYLRRGPDGNPVETEEEMFWRVAWNVAAPERDHGEDQQAVAEEFFHMLTAKRFFPNSPTFTGAGTPLGQLAACFVLKIEDDMGRTGEGIFETLRNAALIQQTGGGNGFAFSGLRPAGAIVKSSNGQATGPIGFLRVYDQAFGEIAQGGCLTPDTLVHTAEGTLRLDEIITHDEPGWQSHDLMVATDEGPRHSGEAYNNGVVPTLRITTREGLQITGTPDHKFKVMTADGPRWKQAKDLQPGDALIAQLGQHEGVVQPALVAAMGEAKAFTMQDAWNMGAVGDGLATGLPVDTLRLPSVPAIVRRSPADVVEAFLNGLQSATHAETGMERDIVVESKAFAREVATLYMGIGHPVQIVAEENRWRVAVGEKTEGQWFITVDTVEDAGEALTLDMEVADNHTYIANGIVTHNSRRGANMGVLRVDHPDIREFITCKTSEEAITNFNISVGITDAFMQAVRDDDTFDLIDPNSGDVWETVRARELFEAIVTHAHHNGEPGMLFLDTANRDNPVPHLYQLEATNPCLVGETRIATEFGLLSIAELAEMDVPLFVTTDNRAPVGDATKPSAQQGVALRPATPAWLTKRDARVMTFTTKQGYTLTATPDHRILTTKGYVELQDLKKGDRVLLQSGEGAWSREYTLPNVEYVRQAAAMMAHAGDHASGNTVQRSDFAAQYNSLPTEWSHDLGLVMGWVVGDGWLSSNSNSSLGMVFAREEVMQRVHEPLNEWFGRGHTHDHGSLYQLTYGRLPAEFLASLGVQAVQAHEKRVPESIWTAPREAVVGFIQGLFTADGSVQLNEHKRDCTVRLASSSRGLLEDVQGLLANFGIVSRIYHRRDAGTKFMPDGKGGMAEYEYHAQFELVLGKANRDRFAELIGFVDSDKQGRLENFIANKARRSNRETFVDAVASVEEAGMADVYDLSQPQTVSMIGNSVVIHNCGEQWLGPFENCCLGSVNLAMHVTEGGRVDWEGLRETVELATRFLDDVVDANAYVPEIPQLRAAAERVRRIGLGIMGLADMMYALGVRYGSEEGQEFAAQVMEFVHHHAMRTSVELARDRGSFLAIRGSMYDPDNLTWQPPTPLNAYTRDWGRPHVDWDGVVEGIKQHGIRNGAQTTIAPTGTISTVAGVEGYGCEPVFALAYVRYFDDNGERRQLQYTSPLFEQALIEAGLSPAEREAIVQEVNRTGTVQHIEAVPEEVRRVFVVSSDITAKEHVRMQAAMQRFVSNAISKTCNFPAAATEQDVAEAFQLAWDLGCKGLTVYVAGSREKVVLETAETKEQRGEDAQQAEAPKPVKATKPAPRTQEGAEQRSLFPPEAKKPRSRVLNGFTYRVQTPVGTAFITINENGGNQPFEVFINTAKAGSETAAVSEAMGRLISYILRIRSDVPPRDRLTEVVRQLEGIGGMRPLGLGPNRVRSLPDGVAQMLDEYIENADEVAARTAYHNRSTEEQPTPAEPQSGPTDGQLRMHIGDLCPECGEAAVVNEEGCRKCYACAYSEC